MRKSTDADFVRKLSCKICPDLKDVIGHDSEVTLSTWGQGLETGKAVEFLSLCSLIRAYRNHGQEVEIPELYKSHPDLFYIRNIIPRYYGSQAGHDAANASSLSLGLKFLGALTPRAIVRQGDGLDFLIFREGHPIHFINHAKKYRTYYLDRPDVLIAKASMTVEPLNDGEILFDYRYKDGSTSGKIRIAVCAELPIISLSNTGEMDIPISAILECSIGKGKDIAGGQLKIYRSLFKALPRPKTVLVNGKNIPCGDYDLEIFLDLMSTDRSKIENLMVDGMAQLVTRITGCVDELPRHDSVN